MATDDSDITSPEPEFPHVRDALRSYSHALDAEPITPMPEDVWEQIHTALVLEASSSVVDLADARQARATESPSTAATTSRFSFQRLNTQRQGIGTKWVGGLVAASVTLLAVGIAVNILSPEESSQVVADAPLRGAPDSGPASSGTSSSAESETSTPQVIQAGFVPPAVTVMSSGTDYTPNNLTSTVTKVLEKVGVRSPSDYFRVPLQKLAMPKNDGMTQSEKSLRDCITAITQSDTSQALIVDRATYMGKEAGVIVIPFAMFNGMDSVPNNPDTPDNGERMSLGEKILARGSDLGVLDIWVVGPDCGTVAFDVYSHVTHSLN